jgi:cobalt-zinc-cadmium efflux system protein
MHTHHHPVSTEQMIDRFGWSILLTVAFVAGEAAAGWWYNSLALLSDAGHNLADGAALGISWYAMRLSWRASTHENTFGYHRAGILAALVNAVSLILIALAIFYEGIQRFMQPEPVNGGAMILVAGAAVGVNLLIVLWLRHGRSRDVNVRSAVIHMFGDMLFSVGVIAAGIVVLWTGWLQADPLISVMIGLFIVWSSWGILKETIHILMEGTPLDIDMDRLVAVIEEVPGVQGVHDLHVWTIASGLPMLTAHIVLEDRAVHNRAGIIDAINHRLHSHFGIQHTTLQTECFACTDNTLYCTLQPHTSHHHAP